MNEKIVIFGAGYEGRIALNRININNVLCFVDNNRNLYSETIQSKKIISLNEFKNLYINHHFRVIISSHLYFDEIHDQLLGEGIDTVISLTDYLIEDAFREKKNKQRIILMNTHAGTNIGDQLISVAERVFFEKYLNEFEIVELQADLIAENIYLIKEYVRDDDIIAISGGGYMGSLWKSFGESNVRMIATCFENNKIIVLPQSIYFEDTIEGHNDYDQSKRCYYKKRNFTICAREEKSYRIARGLIENSGNVFLIPDMATLLNFSSKQKYRSKIGICLRNDKESILSTYDREKLTFANANDSVFFDMHTEKFVGIYERDAVVYNTINYVSSFKAVITDRLHCMILCAITGTPCIVFDNLTGKVKGVYEFFDENPYIMFADKSDSITKLVGSLGKEANHFFYNQERIVPYFDLLADIFRRN